MSSGGRRGTCQWVLAHDRQRVGREGIDVRAVCLCSLGACLYQVCRIAQLEALGLTGRECGAGPLRDELTLFLGEGGTEIQHERVSVRAQLSDDESAVGVDRFSNPKPRVQGLKFARCRGHPSRARQGFPLESRGAAG
jgi:hypothetical protein